MSRSLVVAIVITLVAVLQGKIDAAQKPKVQAAASEPVAAKSTRTVKGNQSPTVRMPRFFSQLDLDDSQREKIRELQLTYNERIRELRKQIESIELERERDVEGVLKAEQKRKLRELKAAVVRASSDR
jgi:hypothetical protein